MVLTFIVNNKVVEKMWKIDWNDQLVNKFTSFDYPQVKVTGKSQFGFQVQFGREDIDLSFIEQLGEVSQTR